MAGVESSTFIECWRSDGRRRFVRRAQWCA